MPPRALGYSHVGTVKYLNSAGQIESGPTPWKRFLVRLKGQVRGREHPTGLLDPHGCLGEMGDGMCDRFRSKRRLVITADQDRVRRDHV